MGRGKPSSKGKKGGQSRQVNNLLNLDEQARHISRNIASLENELLEAENRLLHLLNLNDQATYVSRKLAVLKTDIFEIALEFSEAVKSQLHRPGKNGKKKAGAASLTLQRLFKKLQRKIQRWQHEIAQCYETLGNVQKELPESKSVVESPKQSTAQIIISLQPSVSCDEEEKQDLTAAVPAKLDSVLNSPVSVSNDSSNSSNQSNDDLLSLFHNTTREGGSSNDTINSLLFTDSDTKEEPLAANPDIKQELRTLKKRIESHAFDLGNRFFGGKMITSSSVPGLKKNRVPDGIQKIHAEITKHLNGVRGARNENDLLAYIKEEATKRTGSPTGLWGFFFNKRTDTTKAIYADLAHLSLVDFNKSRSVSDVDQQSTLALVRR